MSLIAIRAAIPALIQAAGIDSACIYLQEQPSIPQTPAVEVRLHDYTNGQRASMQSEQLYTFNLRLWIQFSDNADAENQLATFCDALRTEFDTHVKTGWPATVLVACFESGAPGYLTSNSILYRVIDFKLTVHDLTVVAYA